MTGKCLCIISRAKASEFFYPLQLGVAYPAGAEKLVHGFCRCISEHWGDREFVACKVDLKNAFNEVSRQALLEECATHFPKLFRWGLLVLWTTSHIVAPNGHTWVRTRCSSGRSFRALSCFLWFYKSWFRLLRRTRSVPISYSIDGTWMMVPLQVLQTLLSGLSNSFNRWVPPWGLGSMLPNVSLFLKALWKAFQWT